jgi:hypothetical protein
VEELLPKIFRQVIISRSYRVFFTLIYDDDFFPDRRWEAVLELFNHYHNSFAGKPQSAYFNMINEDTLFDFASRCKKQPDYYYASAFTIDEIREIFAFVRENHPSLFKDFYECNAQKLGGKI